MTAITRSTKIEINHPSKGIWLHDEAERVAGWIQDAEFRSCDFEYEFVDEYKDDSEVHICGKGAAVYGLNFGDVVSLQYLIERMLVEMGGGWKMEVVS